MIRVTATYGGGHDNDDGEAWLKFCVPQSELPNAAPFLFLVDEKLHMALDVDGQRYYAGFAQSNAMARRPTGEAVLTLRGMRVNVKHDIINTLPGKSFSLMLLTEQELSELLSGDDTTDTQAAQKNTGQTDLVTTGVEQDAEAYDIAL